MNRQEAAALARAARAKNLPPLEDRFWSKVDKRGHDECWPWIAAERQKGEGYGAFWLDGRHQPSNRVAIILSGVSVPVGMVACHRCDNPRCCNPAHLFVGTPQDNDADRVRKGRQCKGSQQKHAVLTEELVSRLRNRASEVGPSRAARELGIHYDTAADAIYRRWRHVDTPYNGSRILVIHDGQTKNLKQASTDAGLNYKTVYLRISRLGWTAERALSTPIRNIGRASC